MPGPQAGNPYGPRHDENVVPKVIVHNEGGYGIARWDEQTTEEQCDWIKRYLHENDEHCYTEAQKIARRVKVHRWISKHKKGEMSTAHQRAVEVYYEHYQLKHSLREKDKRNAELMTRIDIDKQMFWDEVERNKDQIDENMRLHKENEMLKRKMGGDLHKENEKLRKQLEEMEEAMKDKVMVDKAKYHKLMKIHNWVKERRGKKIKVLFNMSPELFVN